MCSKKSESVHRHSTSKKEANFIILKLLAVNYLHRSIGCGVDTPTHLLTQISDHAYNSSANISLPPPSWSSPPQRILGPRLWILLSK